MENKITKKKSCPLTYNMCASSTWKPDNQLLPPPQQATQPPHTQAPSHPFSIFHASNGLLRPCVVKTKNVGKHVKAELMLPLAIVPLTLIVQQCDHERLGHTACRINNSEHGFGAKFDAPIAQAAGLKNSKEQVGNV